jgi:hypothetical protein
MNQTDRNIEQRILSFKSNIGSNLKTDYSYPIDTAIHYIEGLINYTYGDVTNNLLGHFVDSVFIDVDLSDGKITPREANSVYFEIIDSIAAQYENLPSLNAHLIFANVLRRDSTAGSVTFGVLSAFCYGSIISNVSWDTEDWWEYGNAWCNAGGYCPPSIYAGTHLDDDAAEQIERKIRLHIGVPQARQYCPYPITFQIVSGNENLGIIINVDTYEYYYCSFRTPYPDILDNYYDYYIFWESSEYEETYHDCLSPTEITFYYIGTQDVVTDWIYDVEGLQEVLNNTEFTDIDIVGEAILGNDIDYYSHTVYSTYGEMVETQYPPDSF